MNNAGRHPEGDALLRHLDGELSKREALEVSRHLEACWQCRTELEDLRKTVAECVRYRENVLAAHLPPGPYAWKDLHREFDRIDAESRPAVAWSWRWAAVGVAAAITAAVLYQWRETPSVKAATLLERAVVAASVRAEPVRQIRIRTKSAEITRVVGTLPAGNPAADAIQSLFTSAHYDWNDPLSARAFQSWRNSVPVRADEVSTLSPENCFQIRTTSAEGELSAATLKLRTSDLHPVEERLEFRNQEWVELTEITEPSVPSGGNVAVVEAPVRPAVPSRPAAFAPRPSASISDELQVLAALHRIGADLGDPVEVQISGAQVVVSGVGVPERRRQQIQGALEKLPNVSVRFSEPAPSPVTPGNDSPSSVASPPGGRTQARIEQQLGGRAQFERFSTTALNASESAMSRAYALRALAQRFPADQESALNGADRQLLRQMALQHVGVLADQTTAIEKTLAPVLDRLGAGAAKPAAAGAPATWQSAVQDVFRDSRTLEKLLSLAMGVTAGETPNSNLPADLLNALSGLHGSIERCRTLLAQN